MSRPTELLELLQKSVPSNTIVTVSCEVNMLESLGVVSGERATTAMRTASLLVPPDTPATFRGLMNLLTGLMRMSPQFKGEDDKKLNSALSQADSVGDFQLTYGTFLPICGSLLEAAKTKRPKGSRRPTRDS